MCLGRDRQLSFINSTISRKRETSTLAWMAKMHRRGLLTNAVDGRRHDDQGLYACLEAGIDDTEFGCALAVGLLLVTLLLITVDIIFRVIKHALWVGLCISLRDGLVSQIRRAGRMNQVNISTGLLLALGETVDQRSGRGRMVAEGGVYDDIMLAGYLDRTFNVVEVFVQHGVDSFAIDRIEFGHTGHASYNACNGGMLQGWVLGFE